MPHVPLASVVVERQCPFTAEMASMTAMLFNGAGRRRGSMVDCMIAAAALAEGRPCRHLQSG